MIVARFGLDGGQVLSLRNDHFLLLVLLLPFPDLVAGATRHLNLLSAATSHVNGILFTIVPGLRGIVVSWPVGVDLNS